MDNVEILEGSGGGMVLLCMLSGRTFEVCSTTQKSDDDRDQLSGIKPGYGKNIVGNGMRVG